jgi:hypothetical protein
VDVMSAVIVSQMFNSQKEKISIQRINKAPFTGQYTLCAHDNLATGAVAPHLLDEETVNWLWEELDKLKSDFINKKLDMSFNQGLLVNNRKCQCEPGSIKVCAYCQIKDRELEL